MRAKLERSCEVCEYRRVSEDDEAHTIQFTCQSISEEHSSYIKLVLCDKGDDMTT